MALKNNAAAKTKDVTRRQVQEESMAERLSRGGGASQPTGQQTMAERLAATPADSTAAFLGQAEVDRTTGLPFLQRMAFKSADTDQERINSFAEAYPEGQLRKVMFTDEWVYKLNLADETEPWKSVERAVPAQMTLDSVLNETLEFGRDVSDVAVGSGGAIAGEIAAAIATRGRSLIARLAAMAAGAAGGEVAQEGAERLIYPGAESAAGIGTRAATAGVSAPVGYGVGAGIGRIWQGVRGRGFLSTAPEAREAMVAINELNAQLEKMGSDVRIPQLSTGQAAEAPIFRRVEELSAALTAPVRRHRQAQVEAVQEVLDSAVDQRSIDAGRQALETSYDAERQRLIDKISTPTAMMSQGGNALVEGIQRFDEGARLQIDALYKLARDIEEPIFDLGSPISAGERRAEGLLADAAREIRGMSVPARELSAEERTALAEQLGIPERLLRSGPIQAAPVDPRIEGIAAEMLSADPAAVNTEILRSWRSRLWDIKQTPTGELPGQAQFQANRLYQSVNRVLGSPTNSNGRFQMAWRNANRRASDRFDTLEIAQVARILRSGDMSSSETVEQLALSLQNPYNASNLRFLRSVVPRETYEQFRNSFKTRLLSRPDQIAGTLDNFDQETLQYLLSPNERSAFRELSESLHLLSTTGVQRQLEAQAIPRAFLRGLVERGDTAGIRELNRLIEVSGGRNSPAGKAVRYGLLDVAFDRFIVNGDVSQMNRAQINEFISSLTNMGLGRFLTDTDRHLIQNMQKIAPFFRFQRGGAGSSIQASEAASGVVEGTPSAIWELIEKAGAGRTLINPRVRAFLLGRAGSEPIDTETIKMLTAAAVTATALTAQSAPGIELLNAATGQGQGQ